MNYFEKSEKELWQEAVDKSNDDRLKAVKALAHKLGHKGKHKESQALLESTLSTIDPNSDTHEWLDLNFYLCNTNCDLNQIQPALDLHNVCISIANDSMDIEMAAWHARNAALCKYKLRQFDAEHIAYVDDAVAAALDTGSPWIQANINHTATLQYLYSREFEKALASAQVLYDYHDNESDTNFQGNAALLMGMAQLYNCNLEKAEHFLMEAKALSILSGNSHTTQAVEINLGKLAYMRGNYIAARKHFKAAGSEERYNRDMEEQAAEAVYWWALVTRDHFKAAKGQKHLDTIMPAIKKFKIEHTLIPLPGM